MAIIGVFIPQYLTGWVGCQAVVVVVTRHYWGGGGGVLYLYICYHSDLFCTCICLKPTCVMRVIVPLYYKYRWYLYLYSLRWPSHAYDMSVAMVTTSPVGPPVLCVISYVPLSLVTSCLRTGDSPPDVHPRHLPSVHSLLSRVAMETDMANGGMAEITWEGERAGLEREREYNKTWTKTLYCLQLYSLVYTCDSGIDAKQGHYLNIIYFNTLYCVMEGDNYWWWLCYLSMCQLKWIHCYSN